MNIVPLFSIPLYFSDLDRPFTAEEEGCFRHYENFKKPNVLNYITINTKVLEDIRLKNLKEWIHFHLKKYIDDIIKPKGYIDPKITTSWINFTSKGQSHHAHNHPNSFLSGVFYISTDDSDKISFIKGYNDLLRLGKKQYDLFNSDTWWMPATTKRLYIFPSTLIHNVPEVKVDQVRISLSFNSWISGEIDGNDGGVSDLNI